MIILRPLPALAFGGTLAARTFIQMSDPQFGMRTKNEGFAHETVNFDFAIATANRLKPAFVIVNGDLINKPGDAGGPPNTSASPRSSTEDLILQRAGEPRRR